jgi:tetratricopeptide (TPR) repeat protein
MFFLSFTTPADRRRKHDRRRPTVTLPRSQVVLTWSLLLVWTLLMSFGVVSHLNPPWLQALSRPGKDVEALDYKHFGDDALRQRRYADATINYVRSLEIRPGQVPVLTNLAVAYRKAGNFASGARLLTEALHRETSPSLKAVIACNLGELREEQGQLDQAVQLYQEALGCNVEQDRIYHRLAMLYIKTEEFDKARAAFEMALAKRLDPALEYQQMLQHAADIYADNPTQRPIIEQQLARGVDAEDLRYYDLEIIRSLQQHDPVIASIHDYLGMVCVRLHDIDAAIDHFRQSLQIHPDNPSTEERLRQLQQTKRRQP